MRGILKKIISNVEESYLALIFRRIDAELLKLLKFIFSSGYIYIYIYEEFVLKVTYSGERCVLRIVIYVNVLYILC